MKEIKFLLILLIVLVMGLSVIFGVRLSTMEDEIKVQQEINHDYLVTINEKLDYDHKVYVKDNVSIHNKLTYLQDNSITDQTKARLSTYLYLRYMDYKDQYEDNAGYSYGVERYLKGKLEMIQAVMTLFCDYQFEY